MTRPHTALAALLLTGAAALAADWPEFRGPGGRAAGIVIGLPAKFGPTENVAWSAALPGRGLSSPVIAGGTLYLTANSGMALSHLHVLAFDARTGAKRWERTHLATGQTLCHPDTTMAAPTPVTDGRAVYCLFATGDLVAYSADGDLLWTRALNVEFPKMVNHVGRASSPVLAGGTLVVPLENQGESYLFGIDAATGKTRWQAERPVDNSWTSPVVSLRDGKPEVLVLDPTALTAYDAATGSVAWRFTAPGLGGGIASPTLASDTLVLTSGAGVTAIKPGPDAAAVWKAAKLRTGMTSPAVAGDRVFTCSGVLLACSSLADGSLVWDTRLKGKYSATPVVADRKVIVCSDEGTVTVLDATAKEAKVLHTAEFGERFQATPAVAEGALYLRTDKHLWCIRGSRASS